MKSKRILFDLKYFWVLTGVFAILICIDIELKLILIPSILSSNTVRVINNIILSIAYSYVAASLFHIIVVYYPHKKRSKTLKPLFDYKIKCIGELLRQCKEIARPISLTTKILSEEDFVQLFANRSMLQEHPIVHKKTNAEYLASLRKKIEDEACFLLTNGEYLSDSQMSFVRDVLNSKLIRENLRPKDDPQFESTSNQEMIGRSIYQLHKQALGL